MQIKDKKTYFVCAHPSANKYYSLERAKPTQLDDDRFPPTIFVLDPSKMRARVQGSRFSYVSLQYSHAPFDGSIARVALSKGFIELERTHKGREGRHPTENRESRSLQGRAFRCAFPAREESKNVEVHLRGASMGLS